MVFAMMAELRLSVMLVMMVFFQQYVEASTVLIATLPEDRCHASANMLLLLSLYPVPKCGILRKLRHICWRTILDKHSRKNISLAGKRFRPPHTKPARCLVEGFACLASLAGETEDSGSSASYRVYADPCWSSSGAYFWVDLTWVLRDVVPRCAVCCEAVFSER